MKSSTPTIRGLLTAGWLFDKIDKYKHWGLFESGDISYIDESTEKVGTKIRLEVAKARNRPAIYEKLLEAIKNDDSEDKPHDVPDLTFRGPF